LPEHFQVLFEEINALERLFLQSGQNQGCEEPGSNVWTNIKKISNSWFKSRQNRLTLSGQNSGNFNI